MHAIIEGGTRTGWDVATVSDHGDDGDEDDGDEDDA